MVVCQLQYLNGAILQVAKFPNQSLESKVFAYLVFNLTLSVK